MRNGQHAAVRLHSVLEERPFAVVGVRERKRGAVDERRLPFRRVCADDFDILLDMRGLNELRRWLAFRADDAVHAKVRVVWSLVPVRAIRPVRDALSVRTDPVGLDAHGLVVPVPHASARERRMGAEHFPVLAEVPKRVAHAVRVLAHVERTPLRDAFHLGKTQVAVSVYLKILVVVAVHVEPRIVEHKHRPVRQLEVVTSPRLVAERPKIDGRMVLEERHHARAALDLRFRPRRRVGERLHAVV